MSEPYTPTTEEVCDGFRGDPRKFEQAGEPIDATGSNYGSKCYAAFHRWLKKHDARIRREALTQLSDADVESAVAAYVDEKRSWDDNSMPLRAAFKAVAKSRERES